MDLTNLLKNQSFQHYLAIYLHCRRTAEQTIYYMSYSDKVINHFEDPQNIGSLDREDPSVGTGMVGAPACGDVMKLQLQINDNGIIEDAKFKTFGCGSAIASSSLITTLVKGRSVDAASEIKNSDIARELSLPPVKIHCSVLAEDAVKSAINDWKKKNRS